MMYNNLALETLSFGVQTKGLHLLLKMIVLDEFEEKDDSTLPFMPQEALFYCTKLYTSWQSINNQFIPNTQLPNVYT